MTYPTYPPLLPTDGPCVSGDELFSDTYPMKLVDDCLYEVYGKVSPVTCCYIVEIF